LVEFHLDNPLDVTLPPLMTSNGAMERTPSGPSRVGTRPVPPRRESTRPATTASTPTPTSDSEIHNVSGEWDLSITRPQGRRSARIVLQKDGEKLSGTIIDDMNNDSRLQGTIWGDSINFTADMEMGGRTTRVTYDGTISGDRMQGTVMMPGSVRGTSSGSQ